MNHTTVLHYKNLETTLSCVKDFLFTIKSDFIKEVTVQGKS